MKKLKKILIVLIAALSVLILSSCATEEEKPEIEFLRNYISISLSQEVALEDEVLFKNVDFKDINFISKDQKVVFISLDKKIKPMGVGTTTVKAVFKDIEKVLTVNVATTKPQFAKVSEIVYNPETAEVSWNPPYLIVEGKEVVATNYEVKVLKNNIIFTGYEKISNTKYKILEGGNYKFIVKAIANPKYAYSEETFINFTVLDAPTGFKFQKGAENTHIIKWDKVQEAVYYKLKINDSEDYVISQNSYTINLEEAGTYLISVKAIKNENEHSTFTEAIEVVKLDKPILKLENGILKVKLSKQEKIERFALTIRSYQDDQYLGEFDFYTDQFDLSNLQAGNYIAQVKSIAQNSNFVISSEISEALIFEKLASPTITFNQTTKEVEVSGAESGVKLFVLDILTQNLEIFEFEEGKYAFDKPFGEFKLWAQNFAVQDNVLNSDFSNELIVKVLGTTRDVQHKVIIENEIEKSFISFQKVLGAQAYQILIDGEIVLAQFISEVDNRINFELDEATNSVFNLAKEYEIEVVALDQDYPNILVYNKQYENKLIVTRLDAVENVNIVLPIVNEPITWEAPLGATGYAYSLYKNSDLFNEDILISASFNVSNLSFGFYKLQIYTLGNDKEFLSSLNYTEIEFSKQEKLQTPVLSFDRENKQLIIQQVENANEYMVFYEEELLEVLTDELVVDLSDLLLEEKQYNFSVIAINSEDNYENGGNLIPSDSAFLSVLKLEPVKKVIFENEKTFKYDDDLLMAIQNSSDYILEIKIDEQIVNIAQIEFSQLNQFTLSVKKLANPTKQDPYLLSSEVFEVYFEALEKVENLTFTNWLLAWEEVQDADAYEVTLTKDNFTKVLKVNENELNLENENFKNQLENGFNFTVKAVANQEYLEEGETQKLSSEVSETLIVSVLTAPEIEEIIKLEKNKYKVIWTEILEAEFVVDFDNDIQIIALNEIVLELDENKQNFVLKLKAISSSFIWSSESLYEFERLQTIETVDVFEDSTFKIDYSLIENAKIFVNEKEIDLSEKIDIFEEGFLTEGIYTFEMEVIAEFSEGNVYYINSEKSYFTFKKHNQITNFRLEEEFIVWKENPYAENYELVFENNLGENLVISLPLKDEQENYVNSFSLKDERLIAFATDSTLEYIAKIKVKISDFQLFAEEMGMLDSDFSDEIGISKLDRVQNVKVSVFDLTDKEQKVLTISWDAVLYASYYNIYVNGQALLENQTETSLQVETFTFENSLVENQILTGIFKVEVRAFGENKLASEKSEVLTFRRLDVVKGYKTTNNKGGLQWNANVYSNQFVFYIENQNQEVSEFIELSNVVSYNFADLLELPEFKEGNLKLYLLTEGDEDLIFSSVFEMLEVTRLDAPEFEVLNDRIVLEKSSINENANFELTIYFKEKGQEQLIELEKSIFSSGVILLPEEFKFKNGSAITSQGSYVFEVVTLYEGYITSVKVAKEKVKLNSALIEGFKKVEHPELAEEVMFEFLINVGNLAQTEEDENPLFEVVILVTNDIDEYEYIYIDKQAQNRQGQIAYSLEELFLAMQGNFTVKVKVSSAGFIDSKTEKITGKRLSQNTTLTTSDGKLAWSRTLLSSASGYMLKVSHGSTQENQIDGTLIKSITNLETVTDTLEGVSGNITANIKILSNMEMDTIVKNSVVLDSFYMGQVELLEEGGLYFEETPYLTVKLSTIEEVSVKQGMVYFKKVEQKQEVEYVLIALDQEFYGKEYKLYIELEDEEYIQALSEMFYQGQYKLSKDKVYSFSIKALALNEGLHSDIGGDVSFKVLNTVSNLNVAWQEYETGEANRYDTVAISWNVAEGILNPQYNYSLNFSAITEGVFNALDNNKYIINSNNALNAKDYIFKVRVLGSSEMNAEDYYLLTSEFSSPISLNGLARPVVRVEEGVFTWDAVPYAEGYYIYYMKRTSIFTIVTPSVFSQNKTWHSEFITGTSWKVPESFSDSFENQAYYIAVVAINKDITLKYMPSPYGTLFRITADEEGNEILDAFVPLIVLKAPDLFGNKEGVLMWHGIDYNYNISFSGFNLEEGKNPFVYQADNIEGLFDIKIHIKIEDSNGRVLNKEYYAVELFYAEVFKQAWFIQLATLFGFDINQKYGIGHIDEFINETFPSIKAGSNVISAMQVGNNLDLISSKYNDGKEFYIPHQVNATISNSILSWNEIVLPEIAGKEYKNSSNKYVVIAENDEGKRIIVTQTDQLSVNLLDFINNDVIKPGNQKIYVLVAGDGDYFLNGIVAPYIQTFVLPSVSASLNKGVLYWDSMQNVSGYLVKALTGGQAYNFIENMNENVWDFNQLSATDSMGNELEYNLTLQALGNGKTILSGKETDFGTIIKLKTPEVAIEKGIFKWENVLNNFGYLINIVGEDNATFNIGIGITEYESVYTGFNLYNFRALGVTTSAIESGTLNYVISSYMEEGLNAVMLQSVKGASIHKGQIAWKAMTDFYNNSIIEYKLSFDQMNYKPYVFLKNVDYTTETVNGETYFLYQLLETYGAGDYKVYLQAYSNGTYVKDNVTYTYLLGEIDALQSHTEFEKLYAPENIGVVDGVLVWENPNPYETSYRVTFVQGATRVSFTTILNEFNPTLLSYEELNLYNQISANNAVDVIVQVLGDNINLMNSDEVRINSFKKLKTIEDAEFHYIMNENEEAGFTIKWYITEPEPEVADYEYVISYIDNLENPVVKMIFSAENSNIIKGYDNDRKLHYGQIESTYLLGTTSSILKYSVAIIPVTTSHFISSSFSLARSISLPESLDGQFIFDVTSQKISWTYNKEGSDVWFRIIDEVVSLDENNQVTSIKTNIYLSQEKHFFSKEIGLHRIKIAVVLGGENSELSNVSSSYVYFYHQTQTGLINHSSFEVSSPIETQQFTLFDFNLFESGEGSTQNPYIISTETHFNNLRYRAEKPSYLQEENVFVFFQKNDLTVFLTNGIQNFAGIYNGQDYTIEYHLVSSKTTTSQEVALFENIASLGQIKNLKINAKITLNHSVSVSSVKLSALSINNNGLIENVLINSFELVNNINVNQVKYAYGAVSVQNNGTIKTVISKADITFVGGPGHQSMLNSEISIGGLVENNAGEIINSGSYANFKITARKVTVAGVAAVSQTNASLTKVFNTGNFEIVINANNSAVSYIAGLVGRNQGVINSSYSSASKISLNLKGTSNTVYIGGLTGLIEGAYGSLINNSFTLTTDITFAEKGTSTLYIGLIIGRTTAQENNAQIRSYYEDNPELSVLNGTLSTFKASVITSMEVLLNQLNAYDENAFEIINQKIVHVWQQDFELN